MPESYQMVTSDDGAVGIQLIGRIDHSGAGLLIKQLISELKSHRPRQVTVDLNRVSYFDDFGVLVLTELRNHLSTLQVPFHLASPPPRVAEILTMTSFGNPDVCATPPIKRGQNFVVRLGDATLKTIHNFRYMVSFLGSVVIALGQVCARPRNLRVGETILLMQKVGVDALPIVAMISFLLGLIMAFVSFMQLEQFGASIFVARLVALAMVSELGPIMTAIIVAGRSGSAFAAEIGTMRISDEIDALYTMGFSPTLFLVVPRILAAMVVVPLLTLFSDVFAIMGGMVISISMMNLTVATYIDQTLKALTLFEIVWSLMKSVVFAILIAWVGCLRGFQVRGGSMEVGNAATSAVVSAIFLIILFDSIFAVIRSYW